MRRAIKHPLVTEKTSGLQANNNQYTFEVDRSASKVEIKNEILALKPNLDIESIKTLVVRGKIKRLGRFSGKKSNWKKAIVRLKAGQTLETFEQVG